METQKTPNSQSNLKKNRTQAIRVPDFRLYYKATVIKTIWCWYRKRNTNQYNRIENPEKKPYTNGQWIFNKVGKNIQWRKDSLSNKWCWKIWAATCKKKKKTTTEYSSMSYTKINSKWIKDLNVRLDIKNILEENIEYSLI